MKVDIMSLHRAEYSRKFASCKKRARQMVRQSRTTKLFLATFNFSVDMTDSKKNSFSYKKWNHTFSLLYEFIP